MITRFLKPLRLLALCALAAGSLVPSLHAQETPAAAVTAIATPATSAATAPTLEDRVADIENYFSNTAPAAALKNTPGPGHNGFQMICAALVLFMTFPGLALFYGGLVRSKNVLSIAAQCFGIAGIVVIMWWAFGYSLVFGKSFEGSALAPFLGGKEFFFLKGVKGEPNTDYSAWVSQSIFSMYQLTFAIITPALIIGAVAERMKFKAIMLFVAIWMVVVYFPMAHMVWGATGFMNGVWNSAAKIPAIDFAGGTVVHMTSGWSALVLCILLGKRSDFGKAKLSPHSMVLCMIGTGMLWVGWYGFNAGSAVAADGIAANAFMATTLAAATGGFAWALIEGFHRGKPSVLGFCSGVVGGLVVVTPACGFVDASGAMLIGLLAGIVPYFFVSLVKGKLGYDDALDTFGVHAVGGTLGAILSGFLATSDANPNLVTSVTADNGLAKIAADGSIVINKAGLITAQLSAIGVTLVISIVATIVITLIVKALVGLRPTTEEESIGLDLSDHGEAGYEH